MFLKFNCFTKHTQDVWKVIYNIINNDNNNNKNNNTSYI